MITRNSIIEASNYIVRDACERTSSGNYIIDVEDVACHVHMTEAEIRAHHTEIEEEICRREEILEVDFVDDSFDVTCALSYCPQYEWIYGDEDIFKCSYKEWLEMPTLPIIDTPFEEE